jgi:hypothetical protein
MAITFEVDDVSRATELVPTRSFKEQEGEVLVFGGDPEMRVIDTQQIHPLLAAVHTAFAEHRPLVLSPDAIWITIAQGFSHHVRLHSEELRERLVRHEGEKRLEIQWHGELPSKPEQWQSVTEQFQNKLSEQVGSGMARLLTCQFSTTGVIEKTASEIILMDMFSPYFSYAMQCVCGIPEITLTGTKDDWQQIRQRIDIINEYGLDFWTESLVPITDKLLAAAEGHPDIPFFKDIYKPAHAYGQETVTGWIARLFPYVGLAGRYEQRNSLLAVKHEELKLPEGKDWYTGPGIKTNDVPNGRGSVLLRAYGPALSAPMNLTLEGGLLSVEQNGEGQLIPKAGYVIRTTQDSMTWVMEEIRNNHRYVATTNTIAVTDKKDLARVFNESYTHGPTDLVAFYHQFEEATLFPDSRPWHILPCAKHQNLRVVRKDGTALYVTRVIDLPDESFLALISTWDHFCILKIPQKSVERSWLAEKVLGSKYPKVKLEMEQIPVVGTSVAKILTQALHHQGDILLQAEGTLAELATTYY